MNLSSMDVSYWNKLINAVVLANVFDSKFAKKLALDGVCVELHAVDFVAVAGGRERAVVVVPPPAVSGVGAMLAAGLLEQLDAVLVERRHRDHGVCGGLAVQAIDTAASMPTLTSGQGTPVRRQRWPDGATHGASPVLASAPGRRLR